MNLGPRGEARTSGGSQICLDLITALDWGPLSVTAGCQGGQAFSTSGWNQMGSGLLLGTALRGSSGHTAGGEVNLWCDRSTSQVVLRDAVAEGQHSGGRWHAKSHLHRGIASGIGHTCTGLCANIAQWNLRMSYTHTYTEYHTVFLTVWWRRMPASREERLSCILGCDPDLYIPYSCCYACAWKVAKVSQFNFSFQ